MWKPTTPEGMHLSLVATPLTELPLPTEPPALRPTEWSMVLIRSYCRYLCRIHGAAAAEPVRHSRPTIPPQVLFEREGPPGPVEDLQSAYGRMAR